MRKLKLYLDTSVLNFFYADDEPEKKGVTQELFKEIKQNKFDAFISATVIEEIEEAPEPKRTKLISLITEYKLKVLEIDEETVELANRYVEHGIIPKRYDEDAIHIAVAAVNELDVVVSWNLEHMVKVKTRFEVNGINKLEGYHEIDISTPEEVIESELE